jgi:hypothetical protein
MYKNSISNVILKPADKIMQIRYCKIALFGKLWYVSWHVWLDNVCNVRWLFKNKKYGSAKNKLYWFGWCNRFDV